MSSSSTSTADGGVAGLSDTPAFLPWDLISWIVRCRWGPASGCTVMMSAPALAKSAMNWSTGAIIKWTSNTSLVWGRIACTTGAPMVMLGTKWPSITSICT